MSSAQSRSFIRYARLKRAGDVLVAGTALIALSPVILGTAALVRVKLGPGVLFRQPRPGLHGEVFEILKFRTMLDPDPAGGRTTDEQRMTPFGRRLRASSLDELPGLINVLRGEMSLVGPRPLRTRYLERYSLEQARRHEVLPGLTGLAQVSGRNALSWDDRFDLDAHYVRTCSLATDLRILLATVPKVFGREGIAETGQATMRDFFGPRRIGDHELRSTPDADPTGPWDLVERSTGRAAARCELHMTGDAAAVIVLHLAPDSAEPGLLRAHAVEILLGVARELEVGTVRIAVPPGIPAREMLPARLGFVLDQEADADAPAVLVRVLEQDDR